MSEILASYDADITLHPSEDEVKSFDEQPKVPTIQEFTEIVQAAFAERGFSVGISVRRTDT